MTRPPEVTSERALRAGPGLGPVRRALLRTIAIYQLFRGGKPSPCRFVPSCSDYAAEAIERHGAWRGGALAARRIGRCHPWGGHGIDLVPEGKDGR